jgi:dolichol-phosphate mannosyltransferase
MNDRSNQPGVLVTLPILNEVNNIGPLLNGIRHELHDIPYTVCIVDDGSKDGTIEKIHELVEAGHPVHLIQRHVIRRGIMNYGSALRTGMEWGLANTTHNIFVEMDGDLSHLPEDMKKGINLIWYSGYDVAIGSKYVPGSKVINRPRLRNFLSLIASLITRIALTPRIKDYSNGFRFFDRYAAETIHQYNLKYTGPIYLSESLAICLRNKLRVAEFPFTYVGRNEGLSKLRLMDFVNATSAILEISYRYHFAGFERKPVDVQPVQPEFPNSTNALDPLLK